MINKVYFSVVIPVLNEEQYLGGLLSDLSNQTCRDFEVVVVDGKSEDSTKEIVHKYQKSLPRLIFKEVARRNVAYQRNYGASNSVGKYLVFIDADSRLPSDFFGSIKPLLLLDSPDGFSNWFSSTQEEVPYKSFAFLVSLAYWFISRIGSPAAPGSLIGVKRSIFKKVGGFLETIYFAEDREFVQRLYKMHKAFKFYVKPIYSLSFRRIEKVGIVKFIFVFVLLNIKRQLGIKWDDDKDRDYPMGGRSY